MKALVALGIPRAVHVLDHPMLFQPRDVRAIIQAVQVIIFLVTHVTAHTAVDAKNFISVRALPTLATISAILLVASVNPAASGAKSQQVIGTVTA